MSSSSPPTYPPGMHQIPPPLPPSTTTSSIRLNHLMLRIRDPEASLRFYNDLLGLHTIFIFNAGPWTIYYLGPRDVAIADLGTSKGLLELYYIPPKEGDTESSNTPYRNGNETDGLGQGFGHLGFTVPDVKELLERAKEFGYEILKPLGESQAHQYGVPGLEEGKVDEGRDVVEGYKFVFRQLAFLRDPDGYWVEIVPQKVESPPSSGS
ncbi:Glyoxalase/Bleomycin resistance protein/Dihydroxybiphenyl dioxygenase [Rhexocercosporidium sp. MPI-PUGE-AT-0058]|nr:Glyoxalase/Bleomycin resistance protein/Dihydroxybiphenyl dioxygenase [Rhexocercosporidium sp. MPI-PUGE-AT-0058]